MGKNKKKNININSIKNPEVKTKLSFSFEYYDNNTKYCCSTWDKSNIKLMLSRLKDISKKTLNELFQSKKVYNFHEVSWNQTIESNGFPDKEVNKLPAYQIGLVGINNQKARVFGGFSQNVFYVVWFDFDHKIWPVEKKHT